MEIVAVAWMILILLVGVVAAMAALPGRLATANVAVGFTLEAQPDEPTEEEVRYAREVAVAADRAAVTARRAREAWSEASEAVDAAWTDYEHADREARRFAAAAVYPVQRRRRVKGENVERERFLHRTALAACRHREISIAQLNDVLAHRGWNERLHPAAQESALRAAVRDHRYDLYLKAAEGERLAWQDAEKAADALRSLRAEACQATVRTDEEDTLSMDVSWWSRQWSTAEPVRAAAA
ncbi:hypothetical protein [Actinoplanes sp. NBRC 103695]|uniref:hypothetical protein n=1 Tax=Actinoplanes sp. NBRC 103695 TaxID=3032202 RepID=UPI0024A5E4DC|nr:hypothetical protein [Actinoplanes sp. NBRC 103695]GLY95856.1 hypothetical protein Acsp02_31110 [Actinoplanes sp. NBRC 103695]